MKKVIFVLIGIIWSSCTERNEVDTELSFLTDSYHNIVLVDTFQNQLMLDTVSYVTFSDFHPLFIGQLIDSIYLSYLTRKIAHRTEYWDTYPMPDSLALRIFVDTSRIVGNARGYILPPPPPELEDSTYWEQFNIRGKIKSYPVFISNQTTDTLNVGYGEYLPIVVQAIDSSGNWKNIQSHYRYSCGTGLTHFYLPPDETLLTSCQLYQGTYTTRLRLAFGLGRINYSNEFSGTIDYQQFEQRY